MELIGTYTSPFTRLVRIFALELGFDIPVRELFWRKTPDELFAVNPRGRIPILRDGTTYIAESRVIVDYLWEKVPERGVTAGLRRIQGEGRWVEEGVLSGCFGILESIMLIRGLQEAPPVHEHPYVVRAHKRMQQCLTELDGMAFKGFLVSSDTFGLADAALICAIDSLEYYGLHDTTSYVNLNKLSQRLSLRPAIRHTHPATGVNSVKPSGIRGG